MDLNAKNLRILQISSHALLGSIAFLGTSHLTRTCSNSSATSALGAIYFSIHPLCVQVVCWSSCLPYIWSAILAWVSLITFNASLTQNHKTSAFLNLISAAAFFGATMCKAAVLLFPVLLTLLRLGKTNKRLPYPEVLHWLLAIRSGLWALQSASDTSEEVQRSAVQLNMVDNIFRASTSVFLYIWRMIKPSEDIGMLFYPVALDGLSTLQRQIGCTAATFLVCVTLISILSIFRILRKACSKASSSLLFGGACCWISYLAILLPCLQLIQHGDPVWFADRYAFLPFALLGPPLVSFISSKLPRFLLLAVCGPLFLVLGMQSSKSCEP